MNKDRPVVVTIGMPAYNAERTIRAAVDGMLRQSFPDFELIISDNASTDGTWSIVEQYARRDNRIRALRQERNIGANANYSAVFRLARSRYFKWASSNDWCAPELLERCVGYLDEYPRTVLVAPRSRIFSDTPDVYTDYDADVAFDQDNAVDRFIQVASSLALNNVLNGVARTEVLRRTRLMEHYPEADIVLLGRIALEGRISLLNERMYYRRMSVDSATALMDEDGQRRHLYPYPTTRSLFPAWRLAAGWVRAVLASDLRTSEKRRALDWVSRMIWWRRAQLWHDVTDIARHPLQLAGFRTSVPRPPG
jgi:glycosyltransferase involved in cell wall biosynthesis